LRRKVACGLVLPVFSFRSCAGERWRQSERDQSAAGDVALEAPKPQAPANPLGHGSGNQGIDGVAAPTHQREQDSELQDLQRDVSARRINKLRQESQKEERRFRIEQIHEKALAKNPSQSRFASRWSKQLLIRGTQSFDSEINQIGRAQIFHKSKGQRGRGQHGRNAQSSRNDVAQGSDYDAQDGNETGGAAVSNTPADDVGHRWTGDDEKNGRAGNKQEKRGMTDQHERPHESKDDE